MFVTQRNHIIFYVQSMQFIEECWKFFMSYEQYFSKNFAHSTNTITQRNYIITYVRSMQFFWITINLSYIQCTQLFKNELHIQRTLWVKQFTFLSGNYAIFRITLKIPLFQHTHNYKKNLHNSIRLKYSMFQWTLKIAHIQHTHIILKICAFNVHCYLKNLHNFVHSKNVIYKRMLKILHIQWTQFFEKICAFNIHS